MATNRKVEAESDSGDEVLVRTGAFRVAPLTVPTEAEHPSAHPRLPMAIEIPSKSGPVTVRVSGAVADSGAQVSILPNRMLKNKSLVTFSPHKGRTDIRGADDSPLNVVGVVDATVSAASPTGEHISTAAKIYVVDNVSECYLSCDVLRGLRIVNEHFPEPGSGDRHDCSLCTVSADPSGCD